MYVNIMLTSKMLKMLKNQLYEQVGKPEIEFYVKKWISF